MLYKLKICYIIYDVYKENNDDILRDRFLEDFSDLEKLVSQKLFKNKLENKLNDAV